MKESVLQRVKEVITAKSKSVNDFSSQIGMYQNTVNNQVTGVRGISIDLVLAMLNRYDDVSAEWLLRGEGDMIKSEKTVSNYEIKGTDNSVNISGGSQGDITTNASTDKEIIMKLLEQNQQLINMLGRK